MTGRDGFDWLILGTLAWVALSLLIGLVWCWIVICDPEADEHATDHDRIA